MNSALDGRPLRDSLAALTASNQTDEELRQLMSRMVDEGVTAVAQTTKWGEKDESWEADGAEEDSAVSVVPTLMSPTASVGPTSFAEWVTQGIAEADKILYFSALFSAADEEIISELLS